MRTTEIVRINIPKHLAASVAEIKPDGISLTNYVIKLLKSQSNNKQEREQHETDR